MIAGFGYADCILAGAMLCLAERVRDSQAELRLCKREKLVAELQGILAAASVPPRLYLIGIGLSEQMEGLVETLRRLAARGCEIQWWSSWYRMPQALEQELEDTVECVVEENLSLPDMVFMLAGPWGEWRGAAVALQLGKDSGDVAEFCEAAGFANRVMPAERGRRMLRLFIEGIPANGVEMVSPRLEDYLRVYRQMGHRELKGASSAMQRLKAGIRRAARVKELRFLILGETGTGKESIATCIHLNSEQWDKPFVVYNCASSTPALQESEFHGYCAGAFTGALKGGRPGIFERADGGTVFLDEVGDLSPEAQGMLLRILEEKRVRPVGGNRGEIPIDVRVIAATNKDLWAQVREGRFREDLLYRLQEFVVRTPALREVREDIPDIADSMWRSLTGETLPKAAREPLMGYDWPGNSRELLNVLKLKRATDDVDWPGLIPHYLEQTGRRYCGAEEAEPTRLDEVVARHCRRVYEQCGGNLSRAAELLGIQRPTLRRHLGIGRG